MTPRPTSCDAHSDARSLTLSAPSLFSSGLRIGTVRLFSTMSTVLAIPVDATALAANGPPPAMSQVVISMYSVCRPDSLTLPVTIRSMKSRVDQGRRRIFETGSWRPRCCSSPISSESRSIRAAVNAARRYLRRHTLRSRARACDRLVVYFDVEFHVGALDAGHGHIHAVSLSGVDECASQRRACEALEVVRARHRVRFFAGLLLELVTDLLRDI